MFDTHRTSWRRQIKDKFTELAVHRDAFFMHNGIFVERCFFGNIISRIAMGFGNKYLSFVQAKHNG